MSLQGLMSGAECAIESNPLSQVMKHADGDRSLQQDRIAGPSSSRLHYLPGTASGPLTERDVQLARQFFDGPAQGLGPSFSVSTHLPPPTQFHMANNPIHADLNQPWNSISKPELMQHFAAQSDPSWASEFKTTASFPGSPAHPNVIPQSNFSSHNQLMSPSIYGVGSMSSLSRNMYMPAMSMYNPTGAQVMDKGKGKLREQDLENAFAQAAASLRQTDTAKIEEVEDRFTGLEDSMRHVSVDDTQHETVNLDSRHIPAGSRPQEASEFEQVWSSLRKSDIPPSQDDMSQWEAEFNRLASGEREDANLESIMNSEYYDFGYNQASSHITTFDDEGIPALGDYVFENNNHYLLVDSESLLARAKLLLNENGSLSEAALLLEAAIQKGDLGQGGYEAWILLGETRNMDEREEAGIKALTEGVRRAQDAGANGAGMMALAISYTNESYEKAAHTMLLRWLSTAHPLVEIPPETWESLKQSSWHSAEEVTKAFLNLARMQHDQDIVDPDVQTGLGVLFYTTTHYDRAKDCFQAALAARPMDYQLWNRLGSCLSNGAKHEESLGAYREALNLRPTYVRAISNVAVACLNIGAFQEAAEHLLSALAMQEATAGETSEQLWLTLRRVFLEMHRSDLTELTKDDKRSVDTFRTEFEF